MGCTGTSRCGLEPGTGVLLFTDGLVEARRDRVEFGLPRLSFVVGQLTGAAPDEIIGGALAELEDFTAGESEDDLCLLAARLRRDWFSRSRRTRPLRAARSTIGRCAGTSPHGAAMESNHPSGGRSDESGGEE